MFVNAVLAVCFHSLCKCFVIITDFINVICKAYPTANEKHWIDGIYDDIP